MIIPNRKNNAMVGSQFASSILGITGIARENAIMSELLSGNVPDFMRIPVHIAAINEEIGYSLTYTVLPRFLCIGTNDDHFYVPMAPTTAQVIADSYEMILPTYKMVQDIFSFASVRQVATPLKSGTQMTSTDYYIKHSDIVVEQLKNVPFQALCDGYKKNVIISSKMKEKKSSVFIYGWAKDQNGNFWQDLPLFAGHGNFYADYSHGIRLVDKVGILSNLNDEEDRKAVKLLDILADEKLHILLSKEGQLVDIRY